MKNLLRIGIITVGLCTLPAIAGADTYMLIQGVAGDATEPSHKGWIRVLDFAWGVQNNTSIGSATSGAGAGKAAGEQLQLTIPTGPWSREMLTNLTKGAHYPQVVIDHINPDGRPAYRLTIGTLFLTKYVNAPTAKDPAQDKITGVFGSFRSEYFVVSPEGKVLSAPVGWNFITNTAVN